MRSGREAGLQSGPVNGRQTLPTWSSPDAPPSHGAEPPASRPSKHAKDERTGEGTVHRLI